MPDGPPQRTTKDTRIYVSGHRNPDTDSIAAAIGYAELKSRLDHTREYVPVRLGELNPQTSWALERAQASTPGLLAHILPRAGDVMRDQFPSVTVDTPLRLAGQVMVESGVELLPVTASDGKLAGVLTERKLARRYVRESQEASRLLAPTDTKTIADVLGGQLLTECSRVVDGRVWVLAMSVDSLLRDVSEGDVAVAGDRTDAQLRAIELGVGALVVTNGSTVDQHVLEAAEAKQIPIVSTPLDSYVTGRMITLSSPVSALLDSNPLTVHMNDVLADIADTIKDVSYQGAVVVDGADAPVGLIVHTDVVDPPRRRVILVDHAEQGQSVPGIEHAEIVEILDHHHIGSIETHLPVAATFDPVGSTSTLIAERFAANDIEPSPAAATMLLAAILSDTVILNSVTTTDRDRAMIERLGFMLNLDPIAFGREMFEATSDVSRISADELVHRDAKSYELPTGQTICIAQVETVGDGIVARAQELKAEAADIAKREGYRLYALMLTDVLAKDTHLVVAGDTALAERAFGALDGGGVIHLPGVMSRKKQVAPKLMGQS